MFRRARRDARRWWPHLTNATLETRQLLTAASFKVVQDWGSGLTGEIQIQNTAASPIANWNLEFDYGAAISPIWNASIVSHAGSHYSVSGANWNKDIPANGTVTFGFNAGAGSSGVTPGNWRLNGVSLVGPTTPPPPPLPGLSVADVSVAEGNAGTTPATFTVSLSAPSTQTITVGYATADGTATVAGSDYQAASGTLTFSPGQTSKTVTVNINGDTSVESDEAFTLKLSGATNATLSRATATGTIRNDDLFPSQPPSSGSAVSYAITSDWGSGFQGQVTIKNTGTTTLTGWTLAFDLPAKINSIWDAQIVSQSPGHYKVKSNGWNDSIAPGASVSFGFTASPGGTSATATNFVLAGTGTGSGGGGGTTDPGTPLAPGIVWPQQVFAPYIDATLYPTFDFASAAQSEGLRFFTLGFIVADGNKAPAWGGYSAYSVGGGSDYEVGLKSQIAAVRKLGGDVMVSFGGAANQELAEVITDGNALKAAYAKVVDAYGLTNIDFDIEGGAIANRTAVDRRSQALASLQRDRAAAGKPLAIRFTLPVLPTGLTADGVYVVQSAIKAGVTVSGVNIMAMDYGDNAAPSPSGKMGDYAIQAATSTFNQVKSAYGTSKTDTQMWSLIGVTPMIGMNDVQTEVFDQTEARELLAFAQQKKLGLVSFWSLNRDRANAKGAITYVESTSSSLSQTPFEFSRIFKVFTI